MVGLCAGGALQTLPRLWMMREGIWEGRKGAGAGVCVTDAAVAAGAGMRLEAMS